MAQKLEVVVDEREKRSGLHKTIEAHPDVDEVYTEMLETGDVIVNGKVVFERKDVGDFVGSIKSRRLETQINGMYEMFDPENSYVIIEGSIEDFENLQYTNFSAKSARGYVASITARWQCVPIFAGDQEKLADLITRISRKHFETTKRVVRDPTSSPSKAQDDFFARTVLQLSGVGSSKIDPLRDRYQSVDQLAKATVSDLKEVDGIGKKTARSIVNQFGGLDDK